jgi:glycosyltransferase involved in cell wall biosynthesis
MKISVCIATYNGAKYIHEQLSSILEQISVNDEIIISDDFSTDTTLDIIRAFNDNRIKIFLNSKNFIINSKDIYIKHKTVSYNFWNALEKATGDIIFLSDQDDVWCEKKVEICKDALSIYDLVTSEHSIIDVNGHILKERRYKGVSPIRFTLFQNIISLPFKGCCLAFKKEMLSFILPFPLNTVVHDDWIGCIVFMKGKCGFINEPLIKYRIHDCNVSYKNGTTIIYKLRYRFFLFCNLIKRIYYDKKIS